MILPRILAPLVELLQFIDDRAGFDAAMNMAVDEVLLETAETPLLRTYGWARPSLSFGYFGRVAEAAAAGPGCDLVRRCTGGGIVRHGTDLTYALIIPRRDPAFSCPALELYARVHEALREALAELGIETTLAVFARDKISEACFANPVQADLLMEGRKIAGAAQRRSRAGLLQQGSVQADDLPPATAERFATNLAREVRPAPLDPELLAQAEELARRKYRLAAWQERR